MILPTKRLPEDRSILLVGGEILQLLDEPKTVSRLWQELRELRVLKGGGSPLTYEWFVLALDFLYAVSAISELAGRIVKSSK